jgi:hypothetical protein
VVESCDGVGVEADVDAAEVVGELVFLGGLDDGDDVAGPGRPSSQASATWAGLQPPCSAISRTAVMTSSSRASGLSLQLSSRPA